MALPQPPNVKVDIYRTTNPGSPYPAGNPAQSGVSGYLQPRVQTGRHGTALYLKWTHILFLDATIDVRDAYNSQLDPARDNTKGDTLILTSSDGTSKTAFYVEFVEQVVRGTTFAHQRVYLDRFQPKQWPTDAL